jgi:hypothetical protein
MAKPQAVTVSSDEESKIVSQVVSIDSSDINSEYIRLPADLAYWNALYATAIGAELCLKQELKTLQATLEDRYRKEAKDRPTEKYLESCVNRDNGFLAARSALDGATVTKVRISGVVDAICAKREMLVSLGASLRAELQGPLSINEKSRIHDHRGEHLIED